jgi:hypothetical protein
MSSFTVGNGNCFLKHFKVQILTNLFQHRITSAIQYVKHRDWSTSCACLHVDMAGLSFLVYRDAVYRTVFGCLIRARILFLF